MPEPIELLDAGWWDAIDAFDLRQVLDAPTGAELKAQLTTEETEMTVHPLDHAAQAAYMVANSLEPAVALRRWPDLEEMHREKWRMVADAVLMAHQQHATPDDLQGVLAQAQAARNLAGKTDQGEPRCAECGQDVALNDDGSVVNHGTAPMLRDVCPGSGCQPDQGEVA